MKTQMKTYKQCKQSGMLWSNGDASPKPFSLHCISRQENWADILNLVAVHTPGEYVAVPTH